MPMPRRQIKAKSSANGMTTATTTVVRQSAMNISTMKVTNRIPSIKLWVTVRRQGYEIFAVIERNDLHILGQYVLVDILYFGL